MKCPNCGIENSETQIYCASCGVPLYGPRSVNLNENTPKQTTLSDIKNITGININDLPLGNSTVSEPVNYNKKTSKSNFNISTLIYVLVILSLLGVSTWLFLDNQKLSKNDHESCNISCPEENKNQESNKKLCLTPKFSFTIPDDWTFFEHDNQMIIAKDQITINLIDYQLGKIDSVTGKTFEDIYLKNGYNDAIVNEDVLAKRKLIYITFTSNNNKFIDLYYQYDSEKLIYGQINSLSGGTINNDIKEILSSITINEKKNYQIKSASTPREKLFDLIK